MTSYISYLLIIINYRFHHFWSKLLILLLLLQTSFVFIASTKALNVLQMYFKCTTENVHLNVLLPFYKSGNAWVKYLTMWHGLFHIDIGQFFELVRMFQHKCLFEQSELAASSASENWIILKTF